MLVSMKMMVRLNMVHHTRGWEKNVPGRSSKASSLIDGSADIARFAAELFVRAQNLGSVLAPERSRNNDVGQLSIVV